MPPWYCLLVFCFQFHLFLLFIYSPWLLFYGFLKCSSLDYWFETFPTMHAPINPFYYIYTFGAINFPQSCFSCTSQVSVLFSFSLTLMFSFSWAFFWPMDYLKLLCSPQMSRNFYLKMLLIVWFHCDQRTCPIWFYPLNLFCGHLKRICFLLLWVKCSRNMFKCLKFL